VCAYWVAFAEVSMMSSTMNDSLTAGFTESKHRPWPVNVEFVVLGISTKYEDLCYRRGKDIVYLTSRLKQS
jgi:hypothetical protein